MKNYAEAAGGGAGRMAEAAGRAAREHGVRVAVAPPPHLLHEAAGPGAAHPRVIHGAVPG